MVSGDAVCDAVVECFVWFVMPRTLEHDSDACSKRVRTTVRIMIRPEAPVPRDMLHLGIEAGIEELGRTLALAHGG